MDSGVSLLTAQRFIEDEKYPDAAEQLARLVKTGHPSAEVLAALSAAVGHLGHGRLAVDLLAAAHHVGPGDASIADDYIARLRERGQYRLALQCTTENDETTRFLRSTLYHGLGLPALELQTLGRRRSQYSRDRPNHRRLWWSTGGPLWWIRTARRRQEKAIIDRLLNEPTAGEPPGGPHALADRVLRTIDQDRAAAAAASQAQRHLEADENTAAVRVLATALRQVPDHPLLLTAAASAAKLLNRPLLMIECNRRRLRLDPDQPEVLVEQAQALYELGKAGAALKLLSADTIDPDESRKVRYDIFVDTDLPHLAADYSPRAPWIRGERRALWWRTGGPLWFRRRRGRNRDREIVAEWPTDAGLPPVQLEDALERAADARATLDEASLLDDAGDREASTALLLAAAEVRPDQVIVDTLGWRLYFGSDRETEALVLVERAIALEPPTPSLIDLDLTILRFLGRFRTALDLLNGLDEPMRRMSAVRVEVASLYEKMNLLTPALDAHGHPALLSSWRRSDRRRAWWWTGGPLKYIRNRMERSDQFALGMWRDGNLPLLATLDRVTAACAPESRDDAHAIVDSYQLGDQTRQMWWERANVVARLGAGYVATAVAVVLLARVARSAYGAGPWWSLLVGAAGATVAYLILHRMLFRLTRAGSARRSLSRAVPVIAFLAGAGYLIGRLPSYPGGSPAVPGAVLIAVAGMAAARLAAATAVRFVEYGRMRRFQRADPRAVALVGVLEILDGLDRPSRRNDLSWRTWWIRRLEQIAATVEHDLPAYFDPIDPSVNRHLRHRARCAAAGFRRLTYLVVAAPPGSWATVRHTLEGNAAALATGMLGRLATAVPPPTQPPRRRTKGKTAADIARMIFFAGLPLGVVLGARPWLAFNPTLLSWGKLISVGWALLYVMVTLDPSIREKINIFKALVSLAQGGGAPPAEPAKSTQSGPDNEPDQTRSRKGSGPA